MNETIAAIATPQAAGGISVIRISGADALKVADSVFLPVSGKKLAQYKGYTAAYGHILCGMALQPFSAHRTAIQVRMLWRFPVTADC